MNEWWAGLDQREKYFVGGLGVFVVVMVLYLLIVEPLFAASAAYAKRVQAAEQDLARIQRDAAEYKARGGLNEPPPEGGGQPLVVIVDRSARQFELKDNLRRTQPVGESSIRVQLAGASFDQLVSWLGALSASHGVEIESASITREDIPGSADANITLQRTVQ